MSIYYGVYVLVIKVSIFNDRPLKSSSDAEICDDWGKAKE